MTVEFPVGTPKWMMNLMEGMLAMKPANRYDIGHILSMFKSAIVSIDGGEKCFADVNLKKWIKKTI